MGLNVGVLFRSGSLFTLVTIQCQKNFNLVAKNKKWPTFANVNKKRAIVFPRLIAGFFLALFLFIHAVKTTHHHEPVQSYSKAISGSEKFSAEKNCSICDYQVTKDSYHFHEFPSVATAEKSGSYDSFYNTPFITSIGSVSSGRGPPTIS
jgi:hypothetical protein